MGLKGSIGFLENLKRKEEVGFLKGIELALQICDRDHEHESRYHNAKITE